MKKLYHYTSTQSFESIIKNQCIRMTRSDFMNDPHDCQIFFEIVENYIKEKSMEYFASNIKLGNENKVSDIIEKFPAVEYMRFLYTHIPMYVFSLTEESDSLPIWNYYGGEGVRLSFDIDQIFNDMSDSLCKSSFQFLISTQVEYKETSTILSDLQLNSFSDFLVNEFNEKGNVVKKRNNSIKHRQGQSLEYFIDSYIKSYIKTIDFAIEESYIVGVETEEYLSCDSANGFFHNIFNRHKNLKNKNDLKFKTDLDLYMLILAARYKPATFQNEKEFRIVFFDYSFSSNVDECYSLSHNRFGTCLKPYIECNFIEEQLTKSIKDIVLSPITAKMPLEIDIYKKVICNFVNKYGGQLTEANIKELNHNIRW